MLSSKQRFQAYLQFREQAFNIAATELVAAFDSPVDLFLFTKEDGQQFQSDYLFHCIRFRDTNQKVHRTQRYYAYRKGLLKLNISQLQFNNDPGKALEWLKASTKWSELPNDELIRGLKSHMDFLMENVSESVALKRINVELASKLEKDLDTSDWALMGHYYNRMKLQSFARVCSTQAQQTGVLFVKQALPVREICREEVLSTSSGVEKLHQMKETVKQSVDGFMKETVRPSLKGCFGSLHRVQEKIGRAAAGRMAVLLIPLAAAVAVQLACPASSRDED